MEVGTPAKSAAIWLLRAERIRLVEPRETADGLILDNGTAQPFSRQLSIVL